MALKKPTEFFTKKTTLDEVQESSSYSKSQKEVFHSFQNNLNHIQNLSDFSSAMEGFKENFERVNLISNEVESIKKNIQNTLKKEDLDTAMMSHLLFVKENIDTLQNKIKSVNSNTLHNIKEEFDDIQEIVENFIQFEVPSYKKKIVDSEKRIDVRFSDFKQDVREEIISIDSHLTEKLLSISDTVSGINENYVEKIKDEISILDDKVIHLVENELPRYQKFFAETELKTEKKINDVTDFVETKVIDIENQFQNRLDNLNLLVKTFTEQEIPKYKNLITESKIQVEKDFIDLEESLQNKIEKINESISSLIEESKLQSVSQDSKITNQLLDFQRVVESSKNEISAISNTYENLYKDFRKREIGENEKLESYEKLLESFRKKIDVLENNFTDDVCDLQQNLNISTTKYYDILKKEVGYFEENISNKIKDLEVNIVINEKHLRDIQGSVYDVLDNLKLDLIEEKSQELTEKITYIEEILEKFNEKTLLQEQTNILTEPSNTKTSDPLTPLDQKFVTLDQLQQHYRLFINRIQQQLSTIGGGGAGFIFDLADVDFDTTTGNNKLLIYNQSTSKWVGIASTALSGSGTLIGLTDVDASNLGDGRFLRYDASSSEFTFAPVSATNLELIAGDIQSGILTTNSTNQAVIMSISASTYRSVRYQVQVTEGTNYNMTLINVLHDGAITYMNEFGTINQPIGIATFSSDISGGSLRLLGFPAFASTTTFKVIFTAIES